MLGVRVGVRDCWEGGEGEEAGAGLKKGFKVGDGFMLGVRVGVRDCWERGEGEEGGGEKDGKAEGSRPAVELYREEAPRYEIGKPQDPTICEKNVVYA